MVVKHLVGKHYDEHLGEPSTGYSISHGKHPTGQYEIVQYNGIPWQGAVTLATWGFSDVPLHMFRQELILLCYDRFVSDDLISVLAGVMESIASSQHPLLQGQVLNLGS